MPIAAGIRKGALLKLLAAAFLFFSLFPQLVFSASVRIMPLGDSITHGSASGVVPDSQQYYLSYRKALRDKLTDRGYQIDYVGSQVSGNAIFSDAQHEGHPGWVADGGAPDVSIRPNVYNFLVANPADVVLLHIGTNDVNGGHASANDVSLILDEIDRYSPGVWVVLALIVNQANPPCPLCTTTTAYNDALDAMVQTRLNDKIVVVDMENGAGLDYRLYPAGDMYDTLHPFASGYEKMAEAWLLGLLDILPTADAGTDQNVNPGDAVTLNGSGSTDAIGTIVSYAWVQTGGSPAVTLANANTAQAGFTAPDTSTGTALTFELSITDDKGLTHSDSCVVNVNGRPVADAGPDQQVNPGASVVLDGSNSIDADGSIVAYQWLQTAGTPIVALANAGTVRSIVYRSVGGRQRNYPDLQTDCHGRQRGDKKRYLRCECKRPACGRCRNRPAGSIGCQRHPGRFRINRWRGWCSRLCLGADVGTRCCPVQPFLGEAQFSGTHHRSGRCYAKLSVDRHRQRRTPVGGLLHRDRVPARRDFRIKRWRWRGRLLHHRGRAMSSAVELRYAAKVSRALTVSKYENKIRFGLTADLRWMVGTMSGLFW